MRRSIQAPRRGAAELSFREPGPATS
jgi:hypothetical protein